MSADGAEEDGVDNRVEAATWAPGDSSESAAPAQEADETSAPDSDQSESAEASATGADSEPSDPDLSGSDLPAPEFPAPDFSAPDGIAAASDDSSPATRAAAFDDMTAEDRTAGALPVPPLPAAAAQASTDFRPAAQPYTDTLALGAAAVGGRSLAARMSAPFSALTRTKPKAASTQPRQPAPPAPVRSAPPPAQATRPRPQVRPAPGRPPAQQTRRAQLRLDRIEPWSVMKFSFLMSLVGWVILFVAVSLLYFALSKFGVFTSIEHTVTLVTGTKSNPSGSNPNSWFRASRVLGYTMLVGAVNVILVTALATVGAVLYNLVTMLAGGIEVTLKESD